MDGLAGGAVRSRRGKLAHDSRLGTDGAVVSTTPNGASLRLQFFVASAMFMLYTVSVVVESLRATERRLQEIVSLHKLVTENSRDIIVLSGLDGQPRYISSAVFPLTGWKPQEAVQRPIPETVHPDDLAKIDALVHKFQGGAESGMIEYRIKKRSGAMCGSKAAFVPCAMRGQASCREFCR